MRILLHDYGHFAFPVELSRELAYRGHHILHLYAGSNPTPHDLVSHNETDPANLIFQGVYIDEPLQKNSFVKRWLQEREYGRLLVAEVDRFKPNLVISADTPLDPQASLLKKCKKLGIPFVFWLQDVVGLATYLILKNKIPVLGSLIGKYYINLERQLLRQSEKIILITEDFLPLLEGWNIDQSKTVVIPNWAPINEIPIRPRDNQWAKEHDLIDKLCFMYTGTLGLKHNPVLLLELAIHYKDKPNVMIVIVSETIGANWLREKKEELSLKNLIILDFQPFDQMQYVLASADVLLAILDEDAGIFSVPSKVLTYLCAQRPLLLAVPEENFSARIVTQSQAGIVVNSNDVVGFIRGAEDLLRDDSLRDSFGKNGRSYAEKNFDIQLITDKFETILNLK